MFFFQVNVSLNESALIEYNKQLNSYSNVRDYLMTYTTNLSIMTSNSITLQASTLTQLTQSTNQLTRSSAVKLFEFYFLLKTYFVEYRRLHQRNVIN
jgi:hypothetical protein